MLAYFPLPESNRLILILLMAIVIITPIYAQHELSGSLSGVIETGDYYVLDSIRVNSRDSLNIEQGTTIYFCENAVFIISGWCRAVGEQGDSINFLAEDNLYGWSGITVEMRGQIDFRYCTFRHANSIAITLYTSSGFNFRDCRFSYNSTTNNNTGSALTIFGGRSRYPIKNCVFSNNDNFVISSGLFVTIDSCNFVNNRGILTQRLSYYNVEISNSLIINNLSLTNEELINGYHGLLNIHNTLFINNDLNGSSILGFRRSIVGSSFNNNTIINNYSGNYCLNLQIDANFAVENNIFYNNDVNFDINIEDSLSLIAYNLFNKDDGSYFTGNYIDNGLGVVDTINANGDSSDIYHNLFLNPELEIIDSSFVELLSLSPCIDAGNPLSPFDPDSTIADIGHKFFSQNMVRSEIIHKRKPNKDMISIFPNPTNSTINIDLSNIELSNKRSNISIYNILGELVQNINVNSSFISISETSSFTSGIYFVRLMENQTVISESNLIILK
ncbi:MAG: T9SS type A sorting domain-containing protein [Candidatus Electryonea clarkiae]|nr:T9SS type A sorting domain-containing protein [Candidatus Electryonea clarkiae]MDP8288051.1 T9SS type A sorting domain-containing protein [Candidatus Electryonea clarkiae]